MNSGFELLPAALIEAKKPGDEFAPTELIATVAPLNDPIVAVTEVDRGNMLFEAMRQQFAFIEIERVTGKPPSDEQTAQFAGLMRWAIRGFREWRSSDDPKLRTLTVLIVATRFCDPHGGFWGAFPDGIERNGELLATLSKLIAGFTIGYGARNLGPIPIWEGEAAEKFKKADSDGDWQALSEMWRLFAHTCFPSALLVHVVQCLDRFGFSNLVESVSSVHQAPLAIQVAESLSVDRRFALALASNNPYIQFGAVIATFFHWRKDSSLSEKQNQLLTQLLSKIGNDEGRWAQWMQAFNRHPQRYAGMQQSLGRTLSIVPNAAIESYVDSVVLSTINLAGGRHADGRLPVADCLRKFREAAPLDRRQALWTLAHKRWTAWNFGSAENGTALTDIVGSELDYAIVGYAIECMSTAAVDQVRKDLFEEFVGLPKTWHGSLVTFRTAMNRLLSRFQPYAHASTVAPADDWLIEGRYYTPYDAKVDRYAALMCGVR